MEFRRALSSRTRLVVLNSPHNPTGTMLSADDLEMLGALLDGGDVLVLSDEVYEHVTFDGGSHVTLGRIASLRERTAVVSSFGKSFHTTGWKVGYVSAPRALTAEIQRVHQFVTFAVNTPVQHAYAEFLEHTPDFAEVGRFYEAKRNRFLALTADSPFRAVPCQGTYFQILDYSAIDTRHDVDMAMSLLNDHGVAAIPTSAFMYATQAPPVLRFCFAKRDETLEAAADRLRRI
jgi:methionine aminotransferase